MGRAKRTVLVVRGSGIAGACMASALPMQRRRGAGDKGTVRADEDRRAAAAELREIWRMLPVFHAVRVV